MNNKETPRNSPCPCGSGKKYKNCCYQKDHTVVPASKIEATFSLDNSRKVTKRVTSIDSIPTHNRSGIRPDITKEQMMDLCLDEIHDTLKCDRVGMLVDLVDKVIRKMHIVPTFIYREIAQRMESDQRFAIFEKQICSLRGTDPLALMVEKFPLP